MVERAVRGWSCPSIAPRPPTASSAAPEPAEPLSLRAGGFLASSRGSEWALSGPVGGGWHRRSGLGCSSTLGPFPGFLRWFLASPGGSERPLRPCATPWRAGRATSSSRPAPTCCVPPRGVYASLGGLDRRSSAPEGSPRCARTHQSPHFLLFGLQLGLQCPWTHESPPPRKLSRKGGFALLRSRTRVPPPR